MQIWPGFKPEVALYLRPKPPSQLFAMAMQCITPLAKNIPNNGVLCIANIIQAANNSYSTRSYPVDAEIPDAEITCNRRACIHFWVTVAQRVC